MIAVTSQPSVENAHKMFISTAFGIFIIVMAIVLAGISDKWGNAMIGVMLAMILLDGLSNASVFASFVQKSTFIPTATKP